MSSSSDLLALLGERSARDSGDVTEPMAQSSHVFRAVNVIIQTLASFEPLLVRPGSSDPVTRGPAVDLVARPYEDMGWAEWIEELVGQLLVTGEAFALDADQVETGVPSRRPRRLMIAGAPWMELHLQPGHRKVARWVYRDGSRRVDLLPADAPYVRMFNPADPYRGLAPLQAAAMDVRADYKAAAFNVAALDNGGAVGGFVVLPDDPGEVTRREYIRALEARHAGVSNARKMGLLWGGASYQETSQSLVDLQLRELRMLSRESLFEAFGVPPVLACVFDSAHFNVVPGAAKIFLWHTIMPLARKIEGLFNLFILPRVERGLTLRISGARHPIYQSLLSDAFGALGAAVGAGVPWNAAKDMLGLPIADQDWGDTSLVSAGLASASEVAAGLAAPGELPDESEPRPEGADDETPGIEEREEPASRTPRAVLDAATLASERASEERQTRQAMQPLIARFGGLLRRQQAAVIAELRAALGTTQRADPPAPEQARQVIARVTLRIAATNPELRKLVGTVWLRELERALRAELARLDVAPERIDAAVNAALRGQLVRSTLRAKEIRVTRINATTQLRLRRTLQAGLERGETIQDLAGRVGSAIGGSTRARALTIARAEAGQAVGTARFAAAQAAGAQSKSWLTGANPRGTHAKAGQDYPLSAPIALDEPFAVGSSRLMYPRDPRGEPGEIINCNCVLVTLRRAAQADGAEQWEVLNVIGASRRGRES